MTQKKNIIFMGTPDFALPTLEALHREYGVVAVVTQPDKPKGRGRKLSAPPVKEKAIELGIPVLQPVKMSDSDFIEELKTYKPDIICVVAFRILPKVVYELPTLASFNIHGSLLPKYRGAAPINWAIIKGEKVTGLTSFILKEKVDTGNVLFTNEVDIEEGENYGSLYYRMSPKAADLAVFTIERLIAGSYSAAPQNDEVATPAPKIFKDDCYINWEQSATEINNFIRGLSPIPTAMTPFADGNMKIFKAEVIYNDVIYNEVIENNSNMEIGDYLISDTQFIVACRENALNLIEIQMPGKKRVKVSDFIRGYRGERQGNIK